MERGKREKPALQVRRTGMRTGASGGAAGRRAAGRGRLPVLVVALVAGFAVALVEDIAAFGAVPRPCTMHARDADERARLARLAEVLAQRAFDAIVVAAWNDAGGNEGVSPVLVIPPAVMEELDSDTAVALLTRPQPARPRSAWDALRLGRARPESGHAPTVGDDGTKDAVPREKSSQRTLAPPSCYPTTDIDLERACALLVREALLAIAGRDARIPADAVRDMLVHAPLPPTNPAADPGFARRVQRLEFAGRLSRADRADADRLVAEFEAACTVAERWKSRYDAMLSRVGEAAASEEGRALVAIARGVYGARTGWSTADGVRATNDRSSGTTRGQDAISRSIRKARSDGCSCIALAETLVKLEPVRTPRIEAIAVSGEGRLRVERGASSVQQDLIDAWRRACGLERNAAGWTGVPDRQRPAPPRIRDSPLGGPSSSPRSGLERRNALAPRAALDDAAPFERHAPPSAVVAVVVGAVAGVRDRDLASARDPPVC